MLSKSGFFKSTKIRVILCIEVLLLLIGVYGIFFGRSGVVSGMDNTESLLTEGVDLPAGAYTLKLYYDTKDANPGEFGVDSEKYGYKQVLGNIVPIYPGIGERECNFIVTGYTKDVKVELNVSEGVDVRGIELSANRGCYRVYLVLVVSLALFLDWIMVLWMYNRKVGIARERILAYICVPLFALVASIPSLVDYNMVGADIIYHFMRIEVLSQSIKNGELFQRMHSMWFAGHGYASNFFYADTFLTMPAILRVIGFNLDTSYRIYVILINFVTAIISYISFKNCFKNKYIGILGCALYTLAPYRIYNIYNRAAVGEFTAMIFLPLLVWGFYKIYADDVNDKGYMWNWAIPVIGFSGIIQSHTLSCEMTGFFVVILCLLLWKKTFRKKTFMVLSLVVIMTILINMWFIVPFVDLMLSDNYYFGHNANVLIQERGIYPAQIFYTLQAAGSSSRYNETGMLDTEPIGMGAALLLCVLVWILIRIKSIRGILTAERKKEQMAGDILALLCVVSLVMSTNLFPWNAISGLGKVGATLTGTLQFPTRMTTMVTIFSVGLGCIAGKWLLEDGIGVIHDGMKDVMSGNTAVSLIIAIALIFTTYQVNDTLLTRQDFFKIYSSETMGYSAVLGAEYMPQGADINHMAFHDAVVSDNIEMTDYEKEGLNIEAYVSTDEGGYIELPLLYYKGYTVVDSDTGEKFELIPGDNYDVRVLIPGNYSGHIKTGYTGMWYWHVAEAVSICTGAGLIIYYILRRRKAA